MCVRSFLAYIRANTEYPAKWTTTPTSHSSQHRDRLFKTDKFHTKIFVKICCACACAWVRPCMKRRRRRRENKKKKKKIGNQTKNHKRSVLYCTVLCYAVVGWCHHRFFILNIWCYIQHIVYALCNIVILWLFALNFVSCRTNSQSQRWSPLFTITKI